MCPLIHESFAVGIRVVEVGGEALVALSSIDLVENSENEIASNLRLGFGACYEAVSAFHASRAVGPLSPALLCKHLGIYKENLYGIYCAQEGSAHAASLEFFREEYIWQFAVELSISLGRMSPAEFDAALSFAEGQAGDDGEMSLALERWRAASGPISV